MEDYSLDYSGDEDYADDLIKLHKEEQFGTSLFTLTIKEVTNGKE